MGDIKRLLLVKGFSRYNALRVFADFLKSAFRDMGIKVDVIGENIDDLDNEVHEALSKSYDAILALNGVLADQEMKDGSYLMDNFNAPFFAYYVDHPCTNVERQQTILNRYYAFQVDRNYVDLLLKPNPNIRDCGLIYQAGIESDSADNSFDKRKDEVLFVGTYKCHESILKDLKSDNSPLGLIKQKMAETGVKEPCHTLEALYDIAINMLGAKIPDEEYYTYIYECQDVEYYLRSYFRENAVKALVDSGIPVTVYGGGWDDLDVKDKSLLKCMPPCDFMDFPSIISEYKYVLNVLPWSKAGFHDRIANTLLNGAISFTDESEYINEEGMNDKYLKTYRLDDMSTLVNAVKDMMSDGDRAKELAKAGQEYARRNHTWANRAKEIVDFMSEHTISKEVTDVFGDIESEFTKRGYHVMLPEHLRCEIKGERPRFLLITHQFTRTGAPNALLNLAERLSLKGDVLFMCPELGETVRDILESGYPVVITPKYWERKFVFKGFARKFDMVVANTVLNFPAVMILDGADVPVYWWIHEHESYFEYGRGEIPNPNSFKANVRVLVVSNYVKNIIKKEFDYDADVFMFGVKDFGENNEAKRSVGVPLHFLVIGPISHEKGQDLLVNAYSNLPNGVKDKLKVTFVGTKSGDTFCKHFANDIAKEKNLEYLDAMPQGELMKLLAGSDGVIVCSRVETVSTVAVEAMSLGKCVVAGDSVAISSYIEDKRDGYLYKTEDKESFAELLKRLTLEGREAITGVGANSREIYDKEFSMSSFDKRINEIMFGDA